MGENQFDAAELEAMAGLFKKTEESRKKIVETKAKAEESR